jgi:hypothetical protein
VNETRRTVLRDYLRVRWSTFAYNYRWSDYLFLFDGWIAKCAMAVPVVGYLILFNDSVAQHISFDTLASEAIARFGLSSGARLKLIYFGLTFLGAANILYRLRRPHVLKVGISQFSYVENAIRHFTAPAYIDIHGTIRHEGHLTNHGKYYDTEYNDFLDEALGRDEGDPRGERNGDWTAAKNKFEHLLRSMLTENFFRNDVRRRYSLTACLVLALIGYALLFVPSIDLFAKVLVVILKPMFH